MRYRLWAALVAAMALAPVVAGARPFTVEDLLAQESLGSVTLDPRGRWAILAHRGPYAEGPRFDLEQETPMAAGRLLAAHLAAGGPARPWLVPDPGPGQVFGGFSPSGKRAAVFQLTGDRWRLGVVAVATGQVQWLDAVAPEFPGAGRVLAWLDEDALLVLAQPGPGLPPRLSDGRRAAAELPPLWEAAARGETAVTVVGSGRDLGLRRRSPPRRLLRVDLAARDVVAVAEGEITDFEPSPDGRHVALREAGADLQSRPGRPVQGDWGVGDQAERVSVLDLVSGRRVAPCPGGDVQPSLLAWSPDGRALLVYARDADQPWSTGALWRVSAEGKAVRLGPATLRPVVALRPDVLRAGWIGADPLVLADAGDGRGAGWFRLGAGGAVRLGRDLPAAGELLAADAAGATVLLADRLWRLDPTGGAHRIGPDAPVRPLRAVVGRDGRQSRAWGAAGWATAEAEAGSTLLSVTGRGVARVAALPAGARVLAAAGRQAIVRQETAVGRVEVAAASAAGVGQALATLNARFEDIDPLDVRPVEHLGPEGQRLRSWLFLPPRAPGSPAPPLVVKVYSGDVYADWPRPRPPILGFAGDVRVLVGHGYAVLTPSLPRPQGAEGEPAAGLAARILAVVDAAHAGPATAASFDLGRLALWGHSYGGFTVMAALTQTDRFRAAVALSGSSDLVSEWAGLAATRRAQPQEGVASNAATGAMEAGQGGIGAPPWTDPARYRRNSPLLAADRIVTPLLLMHGDQDGTVGLEQSEAMFSALYRQGKTAQLVTYWGEGHIIASPGNVRDLYARAFRFLDSGFSATTPIAASPGSASANAAPTPRSPRP